GQPSTPLLPYTPPFRSKERAVAVRAVGYTGVAVLTFARHVHLAPAGAGGQNHGAALEHATIFQLDLDHLARGELHGALQVHDVRSEEHTSELQSRENLV